MQPHYDPAARQRHPGGEFYDYRHRYRRQ